MSKLQDSHSVGLLILPHASLSHYGQITELLLYTNCVLEHPKYRLQALSVGGECVLGKVTNYLDSERVDTLFVIGDLITPNETDTMLELWLVQQAKMGVNILAIGTGVLPLANAGLLNGKLGCCHWSVIEKLRATFPKVFWTHQDDDVCWWGFNYRPDACMARAAAGFRYGGTLI